MIRSNTARTAASMKVVGWLLIAGSLVVQPALAHVPYLEDVDYSPEAPSKSRNPWTSRGPSIPGSKRGTISTSCPSRSLNRSDSLRRPSCRSARGTKSSCPGLPWSAPTSPTPDVSLPFDLPTGYGAWVIQNEEPWTPRDAFFEPFGDKWYFDGPVFDEVVSTPGTWYLYYWNPYGIGGDYAAIVGPAEIWAPSDILRAIIYTPVIRAGEELHIECLGCPFVDERVLNDSDGDGVPDPCEEKNCFIATAAFGTETAGKIDTLRSFRDRCLLTNGPGRSFVKFYYEKSPPMAEIVRSRAWLRAAVRILLLPLIGLASLLV